MKTIVLVCTLLAAAPASAQWMAPAGVPGVFEFPAPPLGLTETAPAPTVYVNEQTGSDYNPGTADKPRRTVPRILEAGMVVSVSGTQTTAYTSPQTIECHGTMVRPAWILGGVFTQGGEISGGNCFIDGETGTGGWVVTGTRDGQPTDRIVIRNATLSGGIAIANNFGRARITNVVLYKNALTGNYTNQKESGGDAHCITVGANTGPIWVLDGTADRCNGDGIQVNGGKGGELTTGPVFIGRLSCAHNRQSCWWAKQSHDVIVSGGTASDMRPDVDFTNPGAGGGGQYFARNLVFVDVEVNDSENGILIAGYDSEAFASPATSPVLIAKARFRNIRATRTTFNASDPYSYGYAIRFDGASRRVVQDSTFIDSDGGIGLIRGTVEARDNVTLAAGAQPPPPLKPSLPSCVDYSSNYFARLLGYLANRCLW